MRASSWNQISIGVPRGTGAVWALSVATKFFERRDGAHVLLRMLRTSADMKKDERLEYPANRTLMVGDAKASADHALQIDPPPAHNPINSPFGPASTNAASSRC